MNFEKKPVVIGHRGAARFCPENTLESFRMGFQFTDIIEFDVWLSKDKVPFILHDAKLERTTNGSGYAVSRTFRELREYDAGYHFDPDANKAFPFRGKGLRIPSLRELFETFPDKKFAVEIKQNSEELTHMAVKLLRAHRLEGRSIVGSKHFTVSSIMKRFYPEIPRFLSRRELMRIYLDFKMSAAPKKDGLAIASMPVEKQCGMAFYEKAFIDYLHQKEMRAFFWTVNQEKTLLELAKNGADAVFTDDPALAVRTLGTGPRGA